LRVSWGIILLVQGSLGAGSLTGRIIASITEVTSKCGRDGKIRNTVFPVDDENLYSALIIFNLPRFSRLKVYVGGKDLETVARRYGIRTGACEAPFVASDSPNLGL
jgi:hypothetical protein